MDLHFYIWYYCVICWLASGYVATTRWGELSKKYRNTQKNLYLLALVLTVVLSPIWLLIGLPVGFVKLIMKSIGWMIK